MPIYQFSMPLDAADLEVEVVNYDSGAVTTVSDDPTEGPDGNLLWRVTLDEGDYYMRATDEPGEAVFTANGTLDVVASIASAPGAAETAYFVATGPTDVSDGSELVFVFEADDRHGALPSWAAINGGDIELAEEAGTCLYSFNGSAAFDFTSASSTPNGASSRIASGGWYLKVDGVDLFDSGFDAAPTSDVGNGAAVQKTSAAHKGGEIAGPCTVSASFFAYALDNSGDTLADAAVSPSVGFTLTRVSPAAVQPA